LEEELQAGFLLPVCWVKDDGQAERLVGIESQVGDLTRTDVRSGDHVQFFRSVVSVAGLQSSLV